MGCARAIARARPKTSLIAHAKTSSHTDGFNFSVKNIFIPAVKREFIMNNHSFLTVLEFPRLDFEVCNLVVVSFDSIDNYHTPLRCIFDLRPIQPEK